MRSLLLFRILLASTPGNWKSTGQDQGHQQGALENKNQLSSYSIFAKIKANLPKSDQQQQDTAMPVVALKQASNDCFKVNLDNCNCVDFNVACDRPSNLRNLFDKVASDNIKSLKKTVNNANAAVFRQPGLLNDDAIQRRAELTNLTLVASGITAIQLSTDNLPRLTRLNLDDNLITEIGPDSLQLESLVELSLRNNRITVLSDDSLRLLKKLERIDLAQNRLFWISPQVFWGTKSLTMVNLASTELEYLTFEHLKPIDDLLTSLNLTDMVKLRMDPATTLVKCQQLRTLDVSGSVNIDKQFPFLEKLTELRLNGIKLTQVDMLKFAPNLRRLSLDDNSLGDLDLSQLPDYPLLETLSLRNSQIASLVSNNVTWGFSSPNLRSIDLSNNRLKTIRPKLSNLNVTFYLDGNNLTCSCFLNWLKKVASGSCFNPETGKIVKLPLSSTLSCPAPDLNFPAMPERRVRIGEQINVTCTSSGSVRFKSWNWVAPSGVDTRGVSDWFVFNATREIIGENVITCMSNGPGGKAQEVSSVFVADDYWTNIFYSSLSGVRFRSI